MGSARTTTRRTAPARGTRPTTVGRVGPRGVAEGLAEVRVLLDEAGRAAAAQARHVLPDEHLGVAVRACADADRGDRERLGHPLRDRGGDHLHDDGEAAGRLEGEGVVERPLGGLVAAPLDAVAAEHVLALRGEADVPHDGNAGADEQLDLGDHRLAALELDRVRHALLHEAGRRRERLLRARLVGPEGQVRDDHGVPRGARHGAAERDEVVDGDRDRRLEAVDVVARRVADEQDGDPRLVEDLRGVHVVGGEHRPALSPLLHLPQVRDANALLRRRLRAGAVGSRGLGHGRHSRVRCVDEPRLRIAFVSMHTSPIASPGPGTQGG